MDEIKNFTIILLESRKLITFFDFYIKILNDK